MIKDVYLTLLYDVTEYVLRQVLHVSTVEAFEREMSFNQL